MRLRYMLMVIVILGSMAYARCDAHARKLVSAYSQIVACRDNQMLWRDGTRTPYDDRKQKGFDALLNHPDIEDMFRYAYPRGKNSYGSAPKRNVDPGRIRYEPLFRKMYGSSAAEVRRHLTTVDWFGQTVRVTRVNGVDKQLRAVVQDIEKLLSHHPALKKYLTPIGGTFKWRKIAGTHRLSVHSFGAAIDIRVKYSAYWRWNKGAYRYHNQIPLAIVQAFERHGFIWGGKWYHYDTMHFEYRPELLGVRGRNHSKTSGRAMPPRAASRTKATRAGIYKVVSGDTLSSIARRFQIHVVDLKTANALEGDGIRVGQRLSIPGIRGARK